MAQATLLVDNEQEPEDQIIATPLKDGAERLGPVGSREDARGEELAKATVGAGQVEDIFELAEDGLDAFLPAGLIGKLQQTAGVDRGKRIGL